MRYTRQALLGLLLIKSAHPEVCRGKINLPPHQQGLWQEDFPHPNKPIPMCDGTIGIDPDGDICVEGRVSYKQMKEALKKPLFAPAADSISVTGHLISGTGNVVLGNEANLLYDFVKTYKVNGKEYAANSTMADNLLAASRGTIDGVCFKPTIVREEAYYRVKHDYYTPGLANVDELSDANIIFAGWASIVGEYHIPRDKPFISGHFWMGLVTFLAGVFPAFVFQGIPVLGFTGIFRLFVFGTMYTTDYPQPLQAPSLNVENVQINTEWSTLLTAMKNGLFTKNLVPLYYGVVIKKITPTTGNSCWNVPIAAIDIQAPQTWGSDLDSWVNEYVYPALTAVENSSVDLHFGKRIDAGSQVLSAALTSYNKKCGVELNVQPDGCYHPMCRRTTNVDDFEYPPAYFAGLQAEPPTQAHTEGPSEAPSQAPTDDEVESEEATVTTPTEGN